MMRRVSIVTLDNRVDVESQPADVGQREVALQPIDDRRIELGDVALLLTLPDKPPAT